MHLYRDCNVGQEEVSAVRWYFGLKDRSVAYIKAKKLDSTVLDEIVSAYRNFLIRQKKEKKA